LEEAEILGASRVKPPPGTMGKPSVGVSGDRPLRGLAAEPNESCADDGETRKESHSSDFATDRVEIESGGHREYKSDEQKCNLSGEEQGFSE